MYEFGFFAQDDWRATSKLSLNFGIRYDYSSNSRGGRGGGARRRVVQIRPIKHGRQVDVGPFRDRSKPYNSDRQLCTQIRVLLTIGWTEQTVIRGGYGLMFAICSRKNFWNLVSPVLIFREALRSLRRISRPLELIPVTTTTLQLYPADCQNNPMSETNRNLQC